DSQRDGKVALMLAARACQQTGFKAPATLGTLAAAYAEVGEFDLALETARTALLLSGGREPIASHLRGRIKVFGQGQAYRRTPSTARTQEMPEHETQPAVSVAPTD